MNTPNVIHASLLKGSISLRIAVLFGALLVSTSVTRAQLLWDWSYSTDEGGELFSGTGTLTTTSTATDGYYTVTGITGSWILSDGPTAGTYTITGLIAPGGDGGLGTGLNDNLLAASSPQLTYYMGIAFTDSSGATDAMLSSSSTPDLDGYRAATVTGDSAPIFDNSGIFTATETPEPSTWALMLGGLGPLTYFARRRLNA